MAHYLYTDVKGKKIEIKRFYITGKVHDDEGQLTKHAPGVKAIAYRDLLQEKLGKVVVAWSHMAGGNPDPIVK